MRDYGYRRMARCEALRGSSAERIAWVCQRAWLDGAPHDAVYRQGGAWVRDAQVTDPVQRLGLGLARLGVVEDAAPVAVRHAEVPVQQSPVGRPVAGTATVKVRWTVAHEGIVEVPAQVATNGRAVLAWLHANPEWTDRAMAHVPNGVPRISEVTLPRLIDGRLGQAELAELADRVRLLMVEMAAADGQQGRPLLVSTGQ